MKIDYIDVIDRIIEEELYKKRKVAFYPYGKYGRIGRQVASIRYGIDNIFCIDNICEEDGVLRMEEFLQEEIENVTLIITTIRHDLNYKLQKEIESYNVVFRNILEPLFQIGEERFRREKEKHIKENTIVVLGDSHVNLFSGNEMLSFEYMKNDIRCCPTVNDMPFSVIHMGPCLAFNCNRYGTNTRFREKLDFLKENFLRYGDKIMVSMGEIDLRAHLFKQCKRQKKEPEKIADSILQEYMVLLSDLKREGYYPIALGPVAASQHSSVNNSNLSHEWTQYDTNCITEYYTNRLKEECKKKNISCLSVFDKLINEDYSTKSDLQIDGCHLKQKAMNLFYAELFRMI